MSRQRGSGRRQSDLSDIQAQLDRILQSLQQAGDAPAFLEILHEYDDLKSHFMTLPIAGTRVSGYKKKRRCCGVVC